MDENARVEHFGGFVDGMEVGVVEIFLVDMRADLEAGDSEFGYAAAKFLEILGLKNPYFYSQFGILHG